jgi:hypothetical protein
MRSLETADLWADWWHAYLTQASAPQVLEEWVAERDLEEVLHIMGDARVPSGERSCMLLGIFAHTLQKLLLQPGDPLRHPTMPG